MGKRLIIGLVVILLTFLIGSVNTPAQQKETITLKLTDHFPATHLIGKAAITPFAKRVEELTGGKIKMPYFPAQQLGKAKDMLTLVQGGIADISYIVPVYVGKLPLNSVICLPSPAKNSMESSKLGVKIMNTGKFLQEWEANGIKPLWVIITPPYDVQTTKKPVTKLGDLKGLKLRTPGGMQDSFAPLVGVVPVSAPGPELYEVIARGVADGSVMSYASLRSYHIDDIMKYTTYGANFGNFSGIYGISMKKWAALSDEMKRALEKASAEATIAQAKEWDDNETELYKEFKAKGIKIYDLTDADKKEWSKALAPMRDEWVKSIKNVPEWEKALREHGEIIKEFEAGRLN